MTTIFLPNIIGLFGVAYSISTIASMAGIGGGGMLIPLYAIIANCDLKFAIILSIITIAGNTFVRGIYYVTRKHKATANRVLINYNIARLVVPFIGISSFLGYVLNQLLPQIFIFLIIVLILGILILKLFKKTYCYFKKKPTKDSMFVIDDNDFENYDNIDLSNRRGDSKIFVMNNILFTLTSFVITAFFSFVIRGMTDTLTKWGYYIFQVIILLLVAYMNMVHICDIYKQRKGKKFNWLRGDVCWTKKINYVKFSIAGLFTGFFSAMLGIGGSIIINPIMIDLQILPDVVVATSSLLSFFASVIAIILYVGTGTVFFWYFPILFLLGGLGGITGIIILNYCKKNIRLIILIVLIICMIASLVLLCIHQVFAFIDL